MDIKDLKTLIKMVTETDITEFEVESEGEKVIIRRGGPSPQVTVTAVPAPVTPAQGFAAPAQPAQPVTASEAPAPKEAAAETGLETILSPIVGTFYRSPSPESDPYVDAGIEVAKGQVLCIVEAMKLMNEIEAEFKCKIVKILKENAQPVEFGEPLFLVERL
ncbi:MAG: acetyl-CoA carboxylase biotin carboxyl carrier protein [Syntrophotaleaceae bacterium]